MSNIRTIHAREVLDSRGRPTVEVEITCECGAFGRAIVPSGASTGTAEACELRDQDPDRYDGQGVLKAVSNVTRIIAPQLIGQDASQQSQVDHLLSELDPTEGHQDLGANALLGCSLAVAHAAAASMKQPLWKHLHSLNLEAARKADAEEPTVITNVRKPGQRFSNPDLDPCMPVPMTNMISGGLHAGGKMAFQDFMVMPIGAKSYRSGLEWIVRVYRRLGTLLAERGYESALVGDEGGFGPHLKSDREAAEIVVEAIEAAGLVPGKDMQIAIDVASSHFFDGDHYAISNGDNTKLSGPEMIDRLESLVKDFPIISIEDGLAEEDWANWEDLTRRLGNQVWLVGDDLFTTNPRRVWKGIQRGVANSVLIKVNQIGTLSGALQALAVARLAGYSAVVSARSGETEDTTIADLAVASGCGQIKIGAIVRGERLVKYNRLLRIEEELQQDQKD